MDRPFRVRLNCIDHYQSIPTEFDPELPRSDKSGPKHLRPPVPIIRIFGATETGQKVCAHIHGAFPYLYIKYTGDQTSEDVDAYKRQLHASIDHALAVSYRRNMYDEKTVFVAHISLVKGIPFYGYYVGYEFFLKIYLLNPAHMTRLADILRQGTIMKKPIQPYESHMQFLAQWMCDYNLYGCSYIDCSEVQFRSPVPDYLEMTCTAHHWHNQSIRPSLVSDPIDAPRQSHCSIEVDISVQNILNRGNIKSRFIHHDFIEKNQPIRPGERLVQSMATLWQDEMRRRKSRMGDINLASSPFPPEVLVSVSADPRNSQPGGWIHEKEYMALVESKIQEEKDQSHGRIVEFEGFVTKNTFEDHVRTSLESIEDLYPDNLSRIVESQRKYQSKKNCREERASEATHVDEARLLSYEEDEFPYESDEDLAREMETSHRRQGATVDRQMEKRDPRDLRTLQLDDQDPLRIAWCSNEVIDDQESSPLGIAQELDSPAELEALGIRQPSSYNNLDEDTFPIPLQLVTEATAKSDRHGTSMSKNQKRKFSGSKDNAAIDALSYPTPKRSRIRRNVSVHELSGKNSPGKGQYSVSSSGKDTSEQRKENSMKRSSLSSSTGETNGMTRNMTLSFPVVKNPQDRHTIMKLSQKGNAPTRSSQDLQSKMVSFATSSEPGSDISGERKSVLLYSNMTPSSRFPRLVNCVSKIHQSFNLSKSQALFCLENSPPSSSKLTCYIHSSKLPSVVYQDAYYSKEKDVPDHVRDYAGKEFRIVSDTVSFLPDFDLARKSIAASGEMPAIIIDRSLATKALTRRRRGCGLRTWEIEGCPPTRQEIQIWLKEESRLRNRTSRRPAGKKNSAVKAESSQIDGVSQKDLHGFKYSQKQKSRNIQHEAQYMSIMSLEIHVNTRGNLVPNPEQDEICCVFWCLQSDDEDLEVNGVNEGTHIGILVLSEESNIGHNISKCSAVSVEEETSELNVINRMVDIVRTYDPDILTGYEVHGGSWGYIIERARCKYDYNLCDEFSRMMSHSHGHFGKEDDRWGFNHTSTIRVTGRHMINIWRAMRGELNLLQYTMENIVFQLCHRRIPHYSFQDLTVWYGSGKQKDLIKVVDYYISRVQLDLEILETNELVPRTSEQARLLGVDFFSVFSRGSQFKVESLMFRIAKPENLLLPSPSRKQVGQQNALECLPLVMEPQSALYTSPLLVLDFQSLYPSVMIAYNYCYSTFLGRVVSWRGHNKMGFTDYRREPRILELLKDHINIAPNGIIYVKPDIRKSLLAKMLGEILETRVMVKSGMKVDREDKALQRLLNNRQLALKLIANVTYGYTSASFSGRMPCSEIADSIVQTGRETLEKAIALIHSVKRWGAEVVYGDTDSLFVYLKGRSKDEAFDIGEEIAKTITAMNPRPVKLKFEKVYFPCLLLAKKRYVGFKYETKSQQVPEFDAKGIETVRRDGTPAEQKIEETALKILFRTADLSQVKDYFQRQCTKIMKGKVSLQDFCFAKEVKLGTYSAKGLPPPGALISTRRMLEDPRAEPQYGERIPYVVITGAPGARLIDRCVAPDLLLENDNNELDAEFYISKNIIPPLERIFNLVGANVRQWYDEMPKFQRARQVDTAVNPQAKSWSISRKTLESYMKSTLCIVCRTKLEEEIAICSSCLQDADISLLTLRGRLNKMMDKVCNLQKICRSCAGLAWGEDVKCDSKDCPVFYSRTRYTAGLKTTRVIVEPLMGLLEELNADMEDW